MADIGVIKSCPFCNSKAELMEKERQVSCTEKKLLYDVRCVNASCYLCCGADWMLSDKEAIIKLWNTRG